MKNKISTIIFLIILVLIVGGSQIFLKVYSNKENENKVVENSDTEILDEKEAVIKEISYESFEEEVLKSEKIVLIDFYATWCEPCKMLSPIVEEFAKENENVKVVKVDVDKEIELASAFYAYSIPTLVVIESGEVKNHAVGVISKENIERLVFGGK